MNDSIAALMATQRPFLSDGGMETTLIFHDRVDLKHFASFTELSSEAGRVRAVRYFSQYLRVAEEVDAGFVLDTMTWRANEPWGRIMGLDTSAIEAANRRALQLATSLRSSWRGRVDPIIINGVLGPAGDGYVLDDQFDPIDAQEIHAPQVNVLVEAGADMISALTMTHSGEATGIALAARAADIPVVCSFTVETDGVLPSGQTLEAAIAEVDEATDGEVLFYMINCAHPDHFYDVLNTGASWLSRIGGIRANASRMSHAELDEAEQLDAGDPEGLATGYARLQSKLPALKVLGGCCGTDHRHLSAIGRVCLKR